MRKDKNPQRCQTPGCQTPSALPRERLIVALDTLRLDVVDGLLKELHGIVSFYKIGFELFTAHGWKAVEKVKKAGARVFLDLKLHDIPNTVAKTAAVLTEHEVDMFNVHALGGIEMMKAARQGVDERSKGRKQKPLLLAVTILTSHNQADLDRVGMVKNLREEVLSLARLAKEAGLDGVVTSPEETALLRKEFSSEFLIITPGIRPAGAAKGDQKRTFSPREAMAAGASFLVVGRPITEAASPRQAATSILHQMGSDPGV